MILDIIVEDKKKRLIEHKNNISEAEMKRLALESERKSISFYDALAKKGLSIIGEFKKASPSHGIMASKVNLEERIRQYNEAVDAISCLTEEDHFNGSTEYLKQIRKMTTLPIIRKDFIIDEYQVYEAKVIGADAILLIAAILDDKKFKELYDLAYSLGLDVLCEVHDEEELKRMINLDVKIIGINNRNLKTFEVSLDTTKRLAAMMPDGKVVVAESGVSNDKDIITLKKSGAAAMLIGTALMEAESPGKIAALWKNAYNKADESVSDIKVNKKVTASEIKICGITSVQEIDYLAENKVDYCGMVLFYEKSRRNITIEKAKEFIAYIKAIKSAIKTVAVTVSPDKEELKLIEEAGFDYIQIHGELKKQVYKAADIPIIRAYNVDSIKDISDKNITDMKVSDKKSYDAKNNLNDPDTSDKICAILYDGSIPGNGKVFDWQLIKNINRNNKKLILAGGINKENVRLAIEQIGPDVIDVSSAVEYKDGGKDPEKIKEFVKTVRTCEI